jgi:hypothetical protein
LLAGEGRGRVHGDVPPRWVHRRRPWRGTSAVVGCSAVGNHGGVTTAVSTIVAVLAAVTVAGAAAVVLARRVRRRQWSGQCFVGVERCRSSSWTGGVQVDFLHHGIRLNVELGDDGVDVRQRSGRDLRGQERRGSRGQLLGGGLSFENGDSDLLLIKELTGGQDVTTHGGDLLLSSFDSDDQGVERLLEDLSVSGRKGYDNP